MPMAYADQPLTNVSGWQINLYGGFANLTSSSLNNQIIARTAPFLPFFTGQTHLNFDQKQKLLSPHQLFNARRHLPFGYRSNGCAEHSSLEPR